MTVGFFDACKFLHMNLSLQQIFKLQYYMSSLNEVSTDLFKNVMALGKKNPQVEK